MKTDRLLVCILLAVCAGCSPIGAPVVVEALVLDDDAVAVIADVTLDSVIDLNTGRGERFDVRGGWRVSGIDLLDTAGDLDEVIARARGDGGADIAPHMHLDDDRYVADDYETLFYFTVFANFEAAFRAADAVGDKSRATSSKPEDRAIVGLFASLVLAPFLPLPLVSADNAAYVGPVDGWLALRTAFQQGVPFAMHRGVIAHEFGHRLFFHNVFTGVDGGFDVWRANLAETDPSDAELRALMLLRGLDEGLADVFAISAERSKDAVAAAFAVAGGPYVAETDRRDVEGPFAAAATYDNLRDLSLDADFLKACALKKPEFQQSDFNFYCVGTVVAAALWQAAEADAVVVAEEIEPAVIAALPKLGERLVAGEAFDLDLFLEPFVQALAPGRRRELACTAIEKRFKSLIDANPVPSCS